jgi:hypothetical protein
MAIHSSDPRKPPSYVAVMTCHSCLVVDSGPIAQCDLCGGDRCDACTQYIDCDDETCEDVTQHTLCICKDCAEQ